MDCAATSSCASLSFTMVTLSPAPMKRQKSPSVNVAVPLYTHIDMIDDFSAGHSDNIAPMIDDFGVEADDLHQVGHDDLHDGGDTIGV